MHTLITSFRETGQLHHAYIMLGSEGEGATALLDFLRDDVGVQVVGNPDFREVRMPTMTIEHARELVHAQGVKEYEKGKKIFIIHADVITEEAQNALLKVFEEPTAGTHFFIVTPQDIFLPTLRSRMQMIHLENQLSRVTLDSARVTLDKGILTLKLGERLARVKKITEAITDEEATKQDAIALLNSVERELYAQGIEKKVEALEITRRARRALYDRGAPVKMILEQVMLTV